VVLVPLPKRCAAEMLECEELADLALVIEIEWPASGQVRDDRERRRLALSERPLNVVDGFAASGSLAAIEVLTNRGVADPNQLGTGDADPPHSDLPAMRPGTEVTRRDDVTVGYGVIDFALGHTPLMMLQGPPSTASPKSRTHSR
jgi:hypothetical protein